MQRSGMLFICSAMVAGLAEGSQMGFDSSDLMGFDGKTPSAPSFSGPGSARGEALLKRSRSVSVEGEVRKERREAMERELKRFFGYASFRGLQVGVVRC